MTITNLHPMTLAEAKETLAAIAYDENWTNEELIAATPKDMASRVIAALRICGAAAMAEANGLQAEADQ